MQFLSHQKNNIFFIRCKKCHALNGRLRTVMKHPLAVEGLQEKFKNAMPGELEKFMKENAEAKGMQLLENLNAFVQVSETKRQRTLVQAGGEYLTEAELMRM